MDPRNSFSIDPALARIQKEEAGHRPERSIFTTDPATPPSAPTPETPLGIDPPKPDYNSLSARYRVPPNVIQATVEAGGVEPARAAEVLGHAIEATGGDVRKGLETVLRGDTAATDQLLQLAESIAASRKPAADPAPANAPEDQPGIMGDAARQLAGGVVKGTGSAIAGAYRNAESPITHRPLTGVTGLVRSVAEQFLLLMNPDEAQGVTDGPMTGVGREVGSSVTGLGKDIQAGVSQATKDAIANSTPDGDLFAPSTWTFGKDPSMRGIAMLTLDVFGSMAPIIATSVATRQPAAGAAMGGAQSAGGAAEQARETIVQAGPEGLAKDSAYFNELVAAGATPEEAMELTAQAAERVAAILAAPVGALGGAATGRIVEGGVAGLAGKSVATRVAGGAGISALEEGSQEAAETVATNVGTGMGAGMEVNPTEGTFGDFVMGGLAGGPTGAIGGLRGERPQQDDALPPTPQDTTPEPDPLALPPGQINLGGPDTPPIGPISRAAQQAPESLGGGLSAGAEVRITTPAGAVIEATYDGEDAEGANFTVDGKPIKITREQMASGEVSVAPINHLAEIDAQHVAGLEAAAQEAAPLDLEGYEVKPEPPTLPPQPFVVPSPDQDISTPDERMTQIARDLDHTIQALGVTDMTPEEHSTIIDQLNTLGGDVEDAIIDTLTRGIDHVTESETFDDDYLPATEPAGTPDAADAIPGEALGSAVEPAGQPAPESGSAAPAAGDGRGAVSPEVAPPAAGKAVAPKTFWEQSDEDTRRMIASEIGEAGDLARKVWADIDQGTKRRITRMYRANTDALNDFAAKRAGPGADTVAAAAQEAAPAPTEAQKEAGNYKKGHARWNGLDMTIENAKGAERSGTDASGNAWSVTMPADYGYFKRTEGADGDHVDFYMGPDEQSDTVFVIDQVDAKTGEFDEHKVVLGTQDRAEAEDLYDAGFSDGKGPQRRAGVSKMTVGEFKEWLANGDTKKPMVPEGRGATVREPARAITPDAPLYAKDDGDEQGGGEEISPPPKTRPAGFTFKLADRLDRRENATIAKYRDTPAGEVIAELDSMARRAESAMRERGTDVRGMDGTGQDQWLDVIEGALHHAREIAEELRQTKGEGALWPARDEDTGEVILDGSPMAEAMQFLEDSETMSPPIDAIAPGPNLYGTEDDGSEPMQESQVFPAPAKTQSFATMEKKGPFIELDEAQARVEEWKRIAREIGESGVNRNRLIISLFDYTGAWSQPFADAGYQVVRHDIKHGTDIIRDAAYVLERVAEYRGEGHEIAGVLSACPCTTFAGSGARWWQELHDVESPEAVEKVFGRAGLLSGAKSPLAFNVMLYEATRDVVREARPGFHVLENPIGRIQNVTSLTKPLLRFHPSNFGDTYTKHTQLFGDFNPDLPLANVKATDGSKMQSQMRGDDPLGKEQRSTTPEGFAYAFFMANDPEARKRLGKVKEAGSRAQGDLFTSLGRLSEVADEMAAMSLRNGTPEASARNLVRAAIRKIEAGNVAEAIDDLDKASNRLLKRHKPLSEVIDEVSDALEKKAEPKKPARASTPVKTVEIRPNMDDRPGYERLMVGGEPSTTQTRMTDDGFVVKREVNRTQVIDPQGQVVFQGRHGVQESEVEKAIEDRRSLLADGAKPEDVKQDKLATSWRENKRLKLFKDTVARRYVEQDRDPFRDQRAGIAPDVAAYGDWLARLSDADLDKIGPYFRDDYSPYHGATNLLNGGIAEALREFAVQGVVIDAASLKAINDAAPEPIDFTLPKAADSAPAQKPEKAPEPAPHKVPEKAAGILSSLPQEKQDRAAELKRRLAEKARTQISSGIDPDYIILGGELVALYMEAGTRRFAEMLQDFARDAGLTMRQAQAPMRAAYNHVRDEMDLDGKDISDLDDAATVMAAVRAALAAEEAGNSTEATPSDMEAESKEGQDDAGERVRDDAQEPLAGTPSEPVQAPEEPAQAGRDGEPGGRGNSGAGDGDDGAGNATSRGRGDRAGRPVSKPGKRRVAKRKTPKESAEADLFSTEVQQAASAQLPGTDFVITPDLKLGQGGPAQKFNDNIAAIETLKRIEGEGRRATPREQTILARYVGWGGLKNAFRAAGSDEGEGIAKGWEDRVARLEAILEPMELRAARNSVKAAHYTSETVVNGLWKIAERVGFSGGAVLEPSAGVGNFLGLMPEGLRGKSRVMAVEYDSITARIAKLLYPDATVFHSGFQNVPLPQGRFALAIGNPPFGTDSLYFQHLPEVNRRSIHNQFFLASLRALEPGAPLAMVVSRYLMDAKDISSRVALARLGTLEGAIRLPSSAFQENARTEVVTDILVFRRHTADEAAVEAAIVAETNTGKAPDLDKDQAAQLPDLTRNFSGWLKTTEFDDPKGSGERLVMNGYFERNPHMVLGEIGATGTMHKTNELSVTLPAEDIEQRLSDAIARLPSATPHDSVAKRTTERFDRLAEAMDLAIRGAEPGQVRVNENGTLVAVMEREEGDASILEERAITADTPYSSDYFVGDDGLWRREVDLLDEAGKKVKRRDKEGRVTNFNVKTVEVISDTASIPPAAKWGAKRIAQLRAMLPIRDAFRQQVSLEAQDAPAAQIEANREVLRKAYRAFVDTHGPLHQSRVRSIADSMPDGGLILAVEDLVSAPQAKTVKVKDADILSARVIVPPKRIDHVDTLDDAITTVLAERGGLDIERMASLLGTDEADVHSKLSEGDTPRGFLDPEQGHWVTVDEYLSGEVRRKLAAAEAAGLEGNVQALKAVAPEPWGPAEITPSLGANWIPPRVYADFLQHVGYTQGHAVYQSLSNTWTLSAQGKSATQWETTEARSWSPVEIINAVMNSSPIKITYKFEEKTVVDEDATRESQARGEELANEFQDWVFADDARRDHLVKLFNEKFNTRVTRQRDGSHLKLSGANPAVRMRRHQKNAIWRGITDRTVLYDHVVGAGKTFTAIARVMERRRMGLSRKPMVVVPNHLTEQWAKDWRFLYPGANLLVAGKKDFEKANRRRLFARIASGDYDAVIIGHSQIGMIPIDPSVEMSFLDEELRDALKAVKEAEEQAAEDGTDTGWRKPVGVAEAERLVTKLEERMAKVRARSRDRLISFQQMGIDDLTIDEAHEFKNLQYSSRLTGVSGMGNKTGSGKAIDLHLKLRSLHDQNAGIAFLTGTPISNSVSEMYLVLRNLAPAQLREMGLENFDAWRTLFVTATSEWEPTESGSLKEVTRLGREWTNMRTLMELYYSVSDAVTLEDIKQAFTEDNNGAAFPVPRVKDAKEGESRRMIAVAPGPRQADILNEVVQDFESLRFISNPKERNAARLRAMDKARKVALDARAVEARNPGDGDAGKIAAVAENIARIYRAWEKDKGTQVVFLDRSVPSGKGDAKVVQAYEDALKKYDEAVKKGDDAAEAKAVEALDKFDRADIEARRDALAGGWNAYDEIKSRLVADGLPAEEIRFVQEADTEVKKKAMFQQVRDGKIRVLIGSTPRMGAGTNVQDRLVALHHVDVTWKPSDIEQREGRIIRQGNKLLEKYGMDGFEVEVIAYATERTVDAKMWDLNGQKLRAINGIRKYDGRFLMEFEDAESASMAEMAALATGDPLMVDRIKLDGERKKLMASQRRFSRKRNALRASIAAARRTIDEADDKAATAETLAGEIEKRLAGVADRAARRSITIEGTSFTDPEEAGEAADTLIAEQRGDKPKGRFKIEVAGLPVTTREDVDKLIRRQFGDEGAEVIVGGETHITFADAGRALAQRLNDALVKQEGLETRTLDGVEAMGFDLEVSVYPSWGGDFAAQIVLLADGEEVAENTYYNKAGLISSGEFAATLRKFRDTVTPERSRREAAGWRREKAEAIKELPQFEAEAEKPWPDAERFDEVDKKLDAVIAALGGKAAAKEPEVEAPATAAQRRRADGQPEAPVMKAMTADLNTELARLGFGGRVKAAAWRKITAGPLRLDGFYDDGQIGVAEDAADPRSVLNHELIHALRDPDLWGGEAGIFTRAEWQALVRAARADKALMDRIRREYADASTQVQTEEAVAEMFAAWVRAQDKASPVAGLLRRIRDVLAALGNALRGNGFASAGRVFEQIANGTMGQRAQARDAQGRFTSGGDDPDDTPPSGGGKRQRRTRVTETAAFRRWFGNSKVVDSAGEPLAVYHGTAADFDAFDPDKLGSSTRHDAAYGGFFFSSSATVANTFAEHARGRTASERPSGPNLIPVYLSLQNPRVIEWNDKGVTGFAGEIRKAKDAGNDGLIVRNALDYAGSDTITIGGKPVSFDMHSEFALFTLPDYIAGQRNLDEVLVELRETVEYWDSEIADVTADESHSDADLAEAMEGRAEWKRMLDAFKSDPESVRIDGKAPADVFIAFKPEQIKSPFNRGSFDASDPRFLHARPSARQKRRPQPFTEGAPSVQAKTMQEGLKRLTTSIMTQAMQGVDNGNVSLLAMVPGRALYQELGADLPAARRYLRLKEQMDALRNKVHNHMDDVAKEWRGLLTKNRKANESMMDLMHKATIEQIDPSEAFVALAEKRDPELVERYGLRSKTGAAAQARIDEDKRRYGMWQKLRARYVALPAPFQKMFRTIRNEYARMADAFDQAILDNAEKAMKVAVRRAERDYQKRIDEIRDDGLTGKARKEAMEEAKQALETAKAMSRFSMQARLASLRAQFESNRLQGPYFPLARFGTFYVTSRDKMGKVVSFSRFELEKDQFAEAERMRKEGYDVEVGAMESMNLREAVDPTFVADVESLLEEVNVDRKVMDEVWQRWLMTLPDLSLRKNRIHRKGTPGYVGDAFRAFGYQMAHGGHQLARLKYGLDLTEALEDARMDARGAPDPVRADLIVNEMKHRHDFVMNPKGSKLAQAGTTAAFVWYLGVTPAAAISNLTQTTVVGAPILGAFHGKGGLTVALKQLARALGDFTKGRAWAETSTSLTPEEKAAMKQAYERGIVDKSQAHDLVGVGEQGIEYNRARTAIMEKVAFFFHHAERLNREVTFLAAYRMARAKGYGHEGAISKAGELTWKSHFDYQNTSRPRIMQNRDWLRVMLVFKNFQINMLWRLFRDIHQSVKGADEEVRAEARRQLVGISVSMMLHAGIKGVWGYALLTALLGMFFGGGADELEETAEQALLAVLPNWMVRAFLNGVPGAALGIDVTNRWGMPELWFRSSDRELSGEDEYTYWVEQIIGAVPGIAQQIKRGVDRIAEGDVQKGVETMLPKAARDALKSFRYATEGATTGRGNPIVDDFTAAELAMQFAGFTPARLARQYELNSRDKNAEQRILKARSAALREARMSLKQDGKISESAVRQITDFNREYPFYAISAATLRTSVRSGYRSDAATTGGVYLNPNVEPYVRAPRVRSLFD
ncbi:PLxRFG domain-containing protein [Sagittula salina]|uniref:PLxRFG domain-containing protein n=1 Tax=Sagittula salina TaxID=2820268 RepID=A0A940MTP2_9RHOB|nr:PLxRFG domain-containing protein [Sagittula salina]MBP0484681.1 PLxRFG domain-containing protein [Sagittula salina]